MCAPSPCPGPPPSRPAGRSAVAVSADAGAIADSKPALGPLPVNQLTGVAAVLAPLLAAGYLPKSRRLRRTGR